MTRSVSLLTELICCALFAVVAPPAALAAEPALHFQTVISADGVPLNVVTAGDPARPAVLFVHGIGQSYLAFENQFGSSLRQDYYLVAFDLRGHGSSGKPWSPQAYSSRDTWAADVASVVDALQLKRPVLVGWSYGTAVVLDYVRARGAQSVSGIVMTGAYGGLMKPNSSPPPPSPEFAQLRADLAGADLQRKWAASRAMAKYLTAHTMPAEWLDRATAQGLLLPGPARTGMFSQPMDNTDLLSQLQATPMLFIMGAKDNGAPSEAQGRELVTQLKRSRLNWHADDGHSPFIESPEQFNRELGEFLGGVAAANTNLASELTLSGLKNVKLIDAGSFVVAGRPAVAREETFEFLQRADGGYTLLSATTMSDGTLRVQARYDYDAQWRAVAGAGQGIYDDDPVRVSMQATPKAVAIRVRGTKTAIDKVIPCPEGCFMDMAPSGSPMFVMTRHYDRVKGGVQSFQWAAQDLPRAFTSPDNQRAELRLRREVPLHRADRSQLTLRNYEMIERIPTPDGGVYVIEFDLWTDDAERPIGYRINSAGGKPSTSGAFAWRKGYEDLRAQVIAAPR